MKNLYSEGPTVFQQLNQKKLSLKSKKEKVCLILRILRLALQEVKK